jgi:ABC-2 type transport system permease protein
MHQYNSDLASGKAPSTSPPRVENAVAALGITGLSQGVPGFGYLLLMIMAALAVTSEYRFGTIKSTFLAVPDRSRVLVTKAGLIAVVAAIAALVLTLASWGIFTLVITGDAATGLSLTHGDLRVFYAVPIFMALVVFLAVGVGALLRQSAGALTLLLVWPVVIEPMVGFFGSYGRDIQVWLPFQNAGRFLGTAGDTLPWHWGMWGGLIYFAVFVAIVFGAALLVVNTRDA